MKFHICYAEGSPSATVTIDGTGCLCDHNHSRALVEQARLELPEDLAQNISKFVIVAPPSDPSFDLNLRFVQASTNRSDELEMVGDCGHSMLASMVSAAEMAIISKPQNGQVLRMNSLNTGAMFLCEAAEDSFGYVFHVHRRYSPHRLLRSFLYQGSPIIEMSCGGSTIEATIVTEGNPYVFVSGTAFNVHDAEELFNLSGATIQPLESIRTYAQRLLNLPKGSVFPKIVLLCSRDGGGIAARAVYQRSWHPSLALTGTIALAIAQNIQGTVPARLIRQNQESATDVTIETAQRLLQARVNATGSRLDDMASAVVIKNKRVFVISHSAEHYRSLPTLKLARTPNPCHEF